MSRSDDYVKVKAILLTATKDAFLINCNIDGPQRLAWIPLSLIHAADANKVGKDHATDLVEFRLREWKAEELDL